MTPTPLPSPQTFGEIFTAIPSVTGDKPIIAACLTCVVVVSMVMYQIRRFRGGVR